MRVNETISPDERMPVDDVPGYLATGKSALQAIRLAQEAARLPDFDSILDWPSGHGRVLRWLQAAYPNAHLTASDLIREGVEFCTETFGATPIYSTPVPTPDLFQQKFDLIWVGSLFTHLDVVQWDRFIDVLHQSLNPEGLLVVTTHGELVAERMRAGHLYGYPAPSVARAVRTFDHAGFAFLEESAESIDYGISLSRPGWVVDRFLRLPDFRLVLFTEAMWANHQDVIAVVKRPVDPKSAERPLV